MSDKPIKQPGPDHPISVTATQGRVTVVADGQTIADSKRALTLREAGYPDVQYLPRDDVDMARLTRTDHATYCPYKGEATYFSLPDAINAAWSYEAPHPAMAPIKDHLAFYPDAGRTTITV